MTTNEYIEAVAKHSIDCIPKGVSRDLSIAILGKTIELMNEQLQMRLEQS